MYMLAQLPGFLIRISREIRIIVNMLEENLSSIQFTVKYSHNKIISTYVLVEDYE